MTRWMLLAVLLLAGCASAPPTAEPATPAPTPVAAKPTVKGVEAVPPTNIGDGSAIEFTMLHGLRKGRGTLEAKPPVALEVADIGLEADGTFRFAFSAVGGATRIVAGTWRKRDGKTVDLTADRLDDAKVGPVAGRMEFMDRANPSRIEIGGEDKTSDGLRLKFDVQE